MSDHDGFLGQVYGSQDPKILAETYDKWAATYDAEMAQSGYRHPAISIGLLARHLPKGAGPILDAGAGTGLIGELLQRVGYPDVEALDISEGMLAVARSKNCYVAFHQLALGTTLPFATGTYAAIISTGVFTSGHGGPEGLDELVRICKVGGVLVLTVKDEVWDSGFAAHLESFERGGMLARLDETPSYVSMPGVTAVTTARCLVLRRL